MRMKCSTELSLEPFACKENCQTFPGVVGPVEMDELVYSI